MRHRFGTRRFLVVVVAVLATLAIGGTAFAISQGTAGELNYQRSGTIDNPGGTTTLGKVSCPSGRHVTGGGVSTDNAAQIVNESRPFDGGDADEVPDDGWQVYVRYPSPGEASFNVWAICDN